MSITGKNEGKKVSKVLSTYDIAIDFTLDVNIGESNRRRLVPVQANKLHVNAILDN